MTDVLEGSSRGLTISKPNRRQVFLLILTVLVYVAVRMAVALGNINPFYFLLLSIVLDQFLSPDDAIDRIVVVAATLFGLVPVLGWLNRADLVAPIEMVTSIWVVSACAKVAQRKVSRPHAVALPVFAGSFAMYQWWRPMSQGTPADVLARILPQWDNSSHFNFFFSNLINRQYLIRVSQMGGDIRLVGHEYPTGIHYLWSLFFNFQRDSLIARPSLAVPAFTNSVTVTLVAAVGIGAISLARLGKDSLHKVSLAIVGTGLSIGLIGVGPLSQTISAGFANMPAVVIGLFLVLTVGLKPLSNRWLNLLVLIGGSLSVLYNWYPMLVLLLPVLINTVVRTVREEPRFVSLGLAMFCLITGAPPVLQTMSLGISHLSEPGGITSFPMEIGVLILLSAFAYGLYLVGMHSKYLFGFTLLIPAIFMVGLGLYLRISTHEYPYYFQKAFLITCVTTGITFAMVLSLGSASAASSNFNNHRRKSISTILSACVLAVALVNVTGFAGPDRDKFAPEAFALGVKSRDDLVHRNWQFAPTTKILLATAEQVKNESLEQRSCYTMFIPDRLGAVGKADAEGWKDLLVNVWFHGLTNSYTVEAFNNSYAVPMASTALSNEEHLPVVIDSAFPPKTVCPVSSAQVVAKLRMFNSKWRTLEIPTK